MAAVADICIEFQISDTHFEVNVVIDWKGGLVLDFTQKQGKEIMTDVKCDEVWKEL